MHAKFQINWTIQTQITEGGGAESALSPPYQPAKSPACLGLIVFLQDDASASIQSLQTSIKIKLYQNLWNGLYRHLF